MPSVFQNPESASSIMICLAILLAAGFLATRLTKRLKLPHVTGYILAGVAVGPCVLNLIPGQIIEHMEFVTDLALAFIAFSTSKFFRISQLRRESRRIVAITLWEALAAAVAVTVVMMCFFHLPLSFALLLGAISSATAPASTLMTIRQYGAKGEFIETLLQVVALDDVVALLAFGACAAVVQAVAQGEGLSFAVVMMPVVFQLLSLVLGAAGGFLLTKLITPARSDEHSLVLGLTVLLTVTGLCSMAEISPLLACMVMGTVYANMEGDPQLFYRLDRFSPPILLLFFILSGMRLDLTALRSAGLIGIVYFFVRIAGKYAGAFLGCTLTGAAASTKKYLGLGLIPQAGVSIGLAALGQRILPEPWGAFLSVIILSSGILYEMVGPACAKLALFWSGSIPEQTAEEEEKPPAAGPAVAKPPEAKPPMARPKEAAHPAASFSQAQQ